MSRNVGTLTFSRADPSDIAKCLRALDQHRLTRLLYSPFCCALTWCISDISPVYIITWGILLWLMEVASGLIRKMLRKQLQSRPWFVALAIQTMLSCTVWSSLPFILEQEGGIAESFGLIVLMGVMVATWMNHIWVPAVTRMVNIPVFTAIILPQVIDIAHGDVRSQTVVFLVTKVLLIANFLPLFNSWAASEREGSLLRVELDGKRREAEELAAEKARFLAHMSHEIRASLASVTLMAGLLRRLDDIPEGQRRMVDQINAGGETILNLLNGVLDFSKLEAGKMPICLRPTDIRREIESIVGLQNAAAQQANVIVEVNVKPDVPDSLYIDGDRVRQVIVNILSNATKYAPNSPAVVNVRYSPHSGGNLRVEIVDRGPGIPGDLKPSLFEPYEQAKERPGSPLGTGLGLAICRGLVVLMGGEIGYKPTQGGGSTFWFWLPASIREVSTSARFDAYASLPKPDDKFNV